MDCKMWSFLWGSIEDNKKPSFVYWDQVFQPCKNRGMGIRKTQLNNKTFLIQLAWDFISNKHALWVQVPSTKYGIADRVTLSIQKRTGMSHTWPSIFQVWEVVQQGTQWIVGDGATIHFDW